MRVLADTEDRCGDALVERGDWMGSGDGANRWVLCKRKVERTKYNIKKNDTVTSCDCAGD